MMQRMKGTLRPGRKAGVLALAVLLLTCVLMAGAVSADTTVAKIDDTFYPTLEDAFKSVQSGDTIELLCDTNGNGIIVEKDSEFTVDLGGYTYTVDGDTVGSPGTETNCFQLLRDSTLTFKNGKIVSDTDKAKIVIQNYADLTLENVELVGSPTVQYVLSNNFGNTQLKGDTSITASGNNVAFDVYYWPENGYGDGVSVTIVDRTVKIKGKVEYAHDSTASDDDFSEKASLTIPPGYTLEAPSGYHWASSGAEWKLVADDPADIADTLVLTVNPQTVTAGNTVTLTATLTNSTSGTEFYGVPVTINGVSGGVTGLTGAPITYTANTVGTFTLTAQTTDPALTSTSVTLTVNPPVAKIGDTFYPTLEAAFNSVQSGDTIELLCDTNGNGIIVEKDSEFTVDLGGYTYTVDGDTVGSPGTETNCFQLLRDSTLTFKNGKIVSDTDKAKIVIQNYADLTLENVELVGSPTVQYVLSNNFGNTQLKGDTSITASGNNVAFDVYYWPENGYGDGVSVTIVDRTVKIKGKVEYAHDSTASDDDFSEKASLTIPPGYTLEAPSGYHWASSGAEWKLVADDPADIADTLVLTVNPQTVTAGNTVTLTATLTNSTSGTEFYGVPVTINGVSGVTGLTGAPITYTANTVGTFTLTAQTTDPALTSTSVTLTVNSRPVPPTPVTSSSGNMDNAYRVLFNDGVTTLSVVTDLSSGDKLTEPATPVKDGYTFAGWYKDSACTQGWDFETGIPGDMTLYAKWTAAGSSGETEATATPTATAVTTPQPTKTQSTTATTSAPQATTAAGVSPTLTQAPAPVAGALFGLLAAGVLLRRRFQ